MEQCLQQHMRTTVRLREMKLQRVEITRTIYQDLAAIARHDGDNDLAQMLTQHRDQHLKALEELAEAQYRSRLYYYALCLMEQNHSLTPDDAIAQAETLVLEAVIEA
jgi:hypothetical protein